MSAVPTDFDEPYDGEDYRAECDCMETDLDILTGIERCWRCGSTRWLSGEEFKLRLKQEAEWAEAYYDEIEKASD
jgi:hypothetical protein